MTASLGNLKIGNKARDVPIIPTKMANLFYHDRLIIAFTTLHQTDKQWSAGAEITWKIDGRRYSHTIALPDRFKTSDDAEKFILNLAKSWIDANG